MGGLPFFLGYNALPRGIAMRRLLQRRGDCMNANSFDDLARRLAESVPEIGGGRSAAIWRVTSRRLLQAQLSKLDLVSRQEFDVQAALLARTPGTSSDDGIAYQGIGGAARPALTRRLLYAASQGL